jgi:hypothetical protein
MHGSGLIIIVLILQNWSSKNERKKRDTLEIEVHVIEKCSRQLSDPGTVAAWPETRARRRSVIFDVANGLM